MKVSVITVCYNSEKTIEDTLTSVSSQIYSNIEHIIIDGGSSDNTLNIIESNKSFINIIKSEPDNGLYDAMNKGLELATGDIIGFLNSDDVYYSPNTILNVVNCFRSSNSLSVYGDLIYVSQDNIDRIRRHWVSSCYNKSFIRGWTPPHPSLFIKKCVYNDNGNFDTSFKLASDFDLMLRFFEISKISSFYLPEILVKMRLGGKTNKSFYNILIQNIEILMSFKKHKISVNPMLYLINRIFPKIFDLLKQKFIF